MNNLDLMLENLDTQEAPLSADEAMAFAVGVVAGIGIGLAIT
ncbi:hypothetical protein [uncultured Microbulbifer sp.]|nr:hypothetical protein [uncultured Microbulbifer sp.]